MSLNKKIIYSLFLAAVLSVGVATPVLADGDAASGYGQGAYGGGVIQPREGNVLIDKTVQNPATQTFVDHLGPDDPKYRPEQVIVFHVKVNNPGNETLEKITVKDVFPSVNDQVVIDYMDGPGAYDADSHTLTFDVLNLEAGQSKEFEVKGRIVHAALLPADQSVICPEPGNIATAQTGDQTDQDESRFCIQKDATVAQLSETPDTGPREWVLLLSGLSAMGGIGVFLRRHSLTIA